MARTVYIAGNWKMHNTIADAKALVRGIVDRLPSSLPPERMRVIIAPPFTALAAVRQEIGTAAIALAAQNVSRADLGAHTAEISAAMLTDLGVSYAIVGHSERRHIYGEPDELIAERAAQALRHNITPILCVGETLPQREAGEQQAICAGQLRIGLSKINQGDIARVLIAYEPVWAIGSGKTASPRDAEEMHGYLRGVVSATYTETTASAIAILYGGSVKPSNSAELLAQNNIDGALIGGASLQAESFAAIIESSI